MTQTDIHAILKKMDDNRTIQDQRHDANLEQFKNINLKLENYQPMADAFNAMTSAGTVAKFIGKWILMPIVVLSGFIYTVKKLFE